MAETKYGKYIVKKYLTDEEKIARGRTPDKREQDVPFGNGLLWLDEKIVKGAFYMEVLMLESGKKSTGEWVKAHTHDTDEILGFVGTNIKNPHSLDGADIELTLGDEVHHITDTCLVFIPKGLKHSPLFINKVVTPVVHFSVLAGNQYLWEFV
jgi:hypothetical protein